MPSIRDSAKVDTTNLQPVNPSSNPSSPPVNDAEPKLNPYLRSPLPPINAGPDSLRQFYGDGIPQQRLIPIQPPSNNGGVTTASRVVVRSTGGVGVPGPPGPTGSPGSPGPAGDSGFLTSLDCQTYTGTMTGLDCN